VKVDILGLGILTCIRKCFDIIKETYGTTLTLATIPAEDKKVYEAICQSDTIGVFQIESRAQMNMLPRLKPRNFFDLVVEISLVRPGPIQGEMVHPYLRRRSGKEKVTFPHPALKAILGKTYGVPLFQEQIMKMAMEVAGFSPGEADELRRAMGTWRRDGKNRLTKMGEKFRQGLIKKGIDSEFAGRIFSQIEGFSEYGFPESHAASFALIAYASAYLKFYYPDAYLTAILNSQPMGFYSSHTLIHDAKRHGVLVGSIHINLSTWDNKLEGNNFVRLGLRQVRSLAKKTALAIEQGRTQSPYRCLGDFIERVNTPLTKRELFCLAAANAFEPLGLNRRQALWEIQGLSLKDSPFLSPQESPIDLPKEKAWERVTFDYEASGVSLYAHPMELFRKPLNQKGVIASNGLKKLPHFWIKVKKQLQVAGIVISRQMPSSASGVLFITLEDEFGFINLVIWNNVFQKFKEVLITQSFLLCEGTLQKAEGAEVYHVIVGSVSPLLAREKGYELPSHDFR